MFKTWWAGTSRKWPCSLPGVQLWPLAVGLGPQGCQVRWLVWPFLCTGYGAVEQPQIPLEWHMRRIEPLRQPQPSSWEILHHSAAFIRVSTGGHNCFLLSKMFETLPFTCLNADAAKFHPPKPLSCAILLLQLDSLKGSDQAEVNTLFLTVIFSEKQAFFLSVKGSRDEIVLYWESNPTAREKLCLL